MFLGLGVNLGVPFGGEIGRWSQTSAPRGSRSVIMWAGGAHCESQNKKNWDEPSKHAKKDLHLAPCSCMAGGVSDEARSCMDGERVGRRPPRKIPCMNQLKHSLREFTLIYV